MRGVMPHHGSLEQTYTRAEAIAALRSIPQAARATLRHYELASLMRPFQSLPPLEPGVDVHADTFLYLAVTDWSLYILSKNKLLLEVPWLAIRDLGVDTVDSDSLFQPDEGKEPVRAHIISIVPQVDLHKCAPHIGKRVQRAADSLAAGDSCIVAYDKSKGPGFFTRLLGLGQQKSRKASKLHGNNNNIVTSKAGSVGTAAGYQTFQPETPLHTQCTARHDVSPSAVMGNTIQQNTVAGNTYGNPAFLQTHGHIAQHAWQQQQQQAVVCQMQNSVQTGWLGTTSVRRPIAESTELQYPLPSTPIQHHHHQQVHQKPFAVQDPFAYCHSVLTGVMNQPAGPASVAAQPPSARNIQHPCQGNNKTTDCNARSPARCRQRQQNGWLGSIDLNSQGHNPCSGSAQAVVHYYTPTKASPARKIHCETIQHAPGVQRPSTAMHPSGYQLSDHDAAIGPVQCGTVIHHLQGYPPPSRSQLVAMHPPAHRLQSPVLVPVAQPVSSDDRWEDAALRQMHELAKYMLVFSTLEEKSRLAYHMRAAWLQAHIRASAAMAGLPGTPVWYTPPQQHATLTGWIPPAHISSQPSPYTSKADMHAYWQHTALQYLMESNSDNDIGSATDLLKNIFPDAVPTSQQTCTRQMQQHRQVSPARPNMFEAGRQANPAAALPNVTGLLQDLAQQLERGHDPRTTPQQVRDAYSGFEARMLMGSSLWDDTDEELLQELLMVWGLCAAPAARALSAAFLGSPITMAFILSRLSAWAALCHLFGPRTPGPSHSDVRQATTSNSSPTTAYVDWVLSRNSDLMADAGQLKPEFMMTGHKTPWTAAQQAGVRHHASAPWGNTSPTKHIPQPNQNTSTLAVNLQTSMCTPAKVATAAAAPPPSSAWDVNEPFAPATPHSKLYRPQGIQDGLHAMSAPGGSFLTPSSQQPRYACSAHTSVTPHSPAGSVGVLHPSTPAARDRKINTRLDMDRMTGRQKTSDEEQYAFFFNMYMAREWRGNSCPPGCVTPMANPTAVTPPFTHHVSCGQTEQHRRRTWHGRQLLRVLRLHKCQAPCINETLAAIQLVINSCNRGMDSNVGRSNPPDVQPTPTLAPSDPLSLSPLAELPCLFALQMYATPAATQQQLQQACHHTQHDAHGGTIKQAWQSNSSANVMMYQTGVYHTRVEGEGHGPATAAIQHAQRRLQGGFVSDALQDGFLEDVLGNVQSPSEHHTKAQAHWERLVGRLAALRAWRKSCLLLRCVTSLICDSQACEQYTSWTSEEVIEVDCVGRSWTWQHCTQLLAGLLPQLQDPSSGSLDGGLQPPSGPHDILWWCKAQAHACWLDSCARIHWQLSDMDKLQACRKRGSRQVSNYPGVLLTAMQALPPTTIYNYCQQLVKRAVCMLSGDGVKLTSAQQPPAGCRPDAADAVAVQCLEVLLQLCGRLPGSAAAVHDAMDHRLMHTLRTPQVSMKLLSRSSNPVLGNLVLGLLAELLAMVGDAHPGHRPGTMWQAGLSQQQVANVASCVTGRHNLPGLLT